MKKAMIKAARTGGDTTRRVQCSKYKSIALEMGFKPKDFPEDVKNGRMQRFDKYLNFTKRAFNQKKSNREENYELDRISRYMKDLIKKNINFAADSVDTWMKLEKAGTLSNQVKQSRYYKIKAILGDIADFGEERFMKMFKESKLKIPRKDCSEVEDDALEAMINDVINANLHHETGL